MNTCPHCPHLTFRRRRALAHHLWHWHHVWLGKTITLTYAPKANA